jgi:hypothetical protein
LIARGHVRAGQARELHREVAHAAGGAGDQHAPPQQRKAFGESVERGEAGDRKRGRAKGEYRVTGQTNRGFLTLKETRSDASSSSGTADLALYPKGGCDLCDFAGAL